MKKILICLTAVAASMTSCIDVEVVDRLEKTTAFYKTEEHAQLAINGVYRTSYEFAYNKVNWPIALTAMEDGMWANGNAISKGSLIATTPQAVNAYFALYKGMNGASELLERIDAIPFEDEANRDRIKAEAHFLRAIYQFDAMRLYGGENGVPIKNKSTTTIDDSVIAQAPAAEVYAQIISDLEWASVDGRLPLYNGEGYELGRVTRGAALAMLSEVNLYAGNYQAAIDNADLVLAMPEHKLIEDYADLWDIKNEEGARAEHIYSIPFFHDADDTVDKALGTTLCYAFTPKGHQIGGEWFCGNTAHNGIGVDWNRVEPWFLKFYVEDVDGLGYSDGTPIPAVGTGDGLTTFDLGGIDYKGGGYTNMDYRIETSFIEGYQTNAPIPLLKMSFPFGHADAAVTNPVLQPLVDAVLADNAANAKEAKAMQRDKWGYVKKYIDPDGIANRVQSTDLPRIRYADMYLIKAEAYNELNKPAEACAAVNEVRKRARAADGTPRVYPKDLALTDKNELRWAIFMERGLEFVGETKRWFDMNRMKYDDNTTMYDHMMEFTAGLSENPDYGAYYKRSQGVLNEKKRCFPFPEQEVLRNPGVKQNSGY